MTAILRTLTRSVLGVPRLSPWPIFFVLYGLVGWLFFSGRIPGWQLFCYLFLLFLAIGKGPLNWTLDQVFWRYFSWGVFLPGTVVSLTQLPYPTRLPVWWMGQPVVQWLAFLFAFLVGYLLFAKLDPRERPPPTSPPAPTPSRSGLRQLISLALLSFLTTIVVYPVLRHLFSYADIVLHAQAIDWRAASAEGLTGIVKFGYLPFSALHALTDLPLNILVFGVQVLLKFAAAAGTLFLYRRWFSDQLAFVGALLVFFYPPVLLSFPQAFLANLGLVFAPIFFYFLTLDRPTRLETLLTIVSLVAAMLTDSWFTGYLPIIVVGWIVYAFLTKQDRRTDRALTIFLTGLAVMVFLVSEALDLPLINAQTHIFRDFLRPTQLLPLFGFLIVAVPVTILALLPTSRRLSRRTLAAGLGLLSLFVSFLFTQVSGESSAFFGIVFSLSGWAVYAAVRSTAGSPRPRHEQLFLVIFAVNVLTFFLLPLRLPFGNYGAFYLLPIPLSYFVLRSLAGWQASSPQAARTFLPVTLTAAIVGGLYVQFSYVSRLVYDRPEDYAAAFRHTLILFALALIVTLSLWLVARRAAPSTSA